MKKALLFFCLCLSSEMAKTQTNIYHPFPDSNATWNVSYFQASPCPTWTTGEYTYYFGNDTIINSTTYHSIFKNGITYSISCYNGIPLGYKGAIRQDTILKKVFIVLVGDTNEKILYDFNLSNVGDTLNMLCSPGLCNTYYHVTEIDSILIDGTYRKKYWYACAPNLGLQYWVIEGIGKSSGLLEECEQGFGVGSYLDCFTQNNQTLYPDSTTQCDLINSVEDFIRIYDVLISPNPSDGIFTLQLTNQHPSADGSSITIFNSLGEVILKSEIQPRTLGAKSEIDLSTHPQGIYFVKVIEGARMAVKKLVKM